MTCGGGTADPIEETSPSGSSSFTYDPALNRYRSVWETERSWRNTCRQLNLRLNDGVDRVAFFRFKKAPRQASRCLCRPSASSTRSMSSSEL